MYVYYSLILVPKSILRQFISQVDKVASLIQQKMFKQQRSDLQDYLNYYQYSLYIYINSPRRSKQPT